MIDDSVGQSGEKPKCFNKVTILIKPELQPSLEMICNSLIRKLIKMVSVRSTVTISTPLLKDCVSCLPFAQWLPKRKSRLGRPDWDKVSLLKAYLVKVRENIPEDTELARKLGDNQTFREFCGFTSTNIPAHDAFSRFFRVMTPKRLNNLFLKLDNELAGLGVFDRDELAMDATDILSNARNRHNPDPEAGYGHKTDGERFHGYWAVFVTGTQSEIVRAVRVTPANVHQSVTAQQLFRQFRKQALRGASLYIADSVCDDKKSYNMSIKLGLVPLIAYNPRNSKYKTFAELPSKNWRKRALGLEGEELRRQYSPLRMSVEHYQSTFKAILNGRAVPVRGLIKVTSYILIVAILSQLYALINWNQQTDQSPHYYRTLDEFLHP